MNSGGGSGKSTTVCGRCLKKLVYSPQRKTWLSDDESMYCTFDGRLSPSALAKIHKPVAGEPR